jgi:ribosomal protein S12 methylthiotransferase
LIEKNVYIISLGCAKNLVDSENIMGLLNKRGYSIVSDIEEASIAVLNTCGFLQSATEECIDTIFDLISRKKRGELEKVIVTGCFVQRYGYKLRRELPEIDGWAGTGEIINIPELMENNKDNEKNFYIGRPLYLADHNTPKIQATPFYSSYLKIAEGCSHSCSFCYIPAIRGNYRSRKPDSILLEAERMIQKGVKEINLIAQDTSMYGKDLENETCLEDLLERLIRINGLEWLRVLYIHPDGVSETLLDLIEHEKILCPYLDIPFQHVNMDILKAMGRNPTGETPIDLVNRIRARNRRIFIRSTLMTGFPGETEEIFSELCEFVREAEIDRLGLFKFSPEKGTHAARLVNILDHKTSEQRYDFIMKLQAEISKKKNELLKGEIVRVLIEGFSDETDLLLKGRTTGMAPDVDGQVLINKGSANIGEIRRVLITETHAYDLIGEITDGH